MKTAVNATVSLPGYRVVGILYDGSRTQVYRAIRDADGESVVIKALKRQYPTFDERLRFQNQHIIAQRLSHPGLVPVIELVPYGHAQAMVIEDVGGISLAEYMQSQTESTEAASGALSVIQSLSIAVQLADVLAYLSQERIIHKDIKPANILIHPQSGQIKLIDFSVSSQLPKERQEINNPGGLEGTLAYLAPEQTGRMNRGVDYRADFYALGVTLFELLTGTVPFESEDVMALIHCHLAIQPPAVCDRNPSIPPTVGEIVHKLMAKNAEERYQSALGLKHDLERCLYALKDNGMVQPFEIGQRDNCDRFSIPEKLYGREEEVRSLLNAFDRVAEGSTEMVLVAGFSGIGKTAVVNEVHKPITRQQGYFIKGKFDQFNRNVPLSAFVQALRDLVAQLLSESDVQLSRWRDRILSAVGENGQLLIDVIPELSQVIGSQPPVSALSGTAAQNRFNTLFQKFVAVFTAAGHSLVLFLDDLQWADSASLQLVKLLMKDQGHLLLLGAYRDNEVFSAHPFMLMVGELEASSASLQTITLQPLPQAQVNQIVADSLNCSLSVSGPLTELIYQKTQGNPFFTTQFLIGLYKSGHISFDMAASVWQCDITAVRSLALTDDVVEFMAAQLQQLSPKTQDMLKLAACIGAQFDLHALAIVSEQTTADTAATLWDAVQAGFVLPITQTYKFFQSNESAADVVADKLSVPYKFLHDRVQQAAYSLIQKEQQQATHLKVGRLFLKRLSTQEKEERLFDIANHFNKSRELLETEAERDELVRLNLVAGNKAKASTAYSAAIAYFNAGLELLTEDCWQSNYALALEIHEAIAEALSLHGDFEAFDRVAQTTLTSAKTLLEKVPTYELQIQTHVARHQLVDAVDLALDVLKSLGVQLSKTPSKARTVLALGKTKLILLRKKPQDLAALPEMVDPEKLAIMRMLSSALSASFMGAPKLFPLLVLQQVNLSVKYGNTPTSALAYAWYGAILCGVLVDVEAGYEFGQLAMQVLEKLPDPSLSCKTAFVVNGFVSQWKCSLHELIPQVKAAYLVGVENGDLEYAGWTTMTWATFAYWTGQDLIGLEQELGHYIDAIKKSKRELIVRYLNIYRQAAVNLTRDVEQPDILEGVFYSEKQDIEIQVKANDRSGLFISFVNQLRMRYLFNNLSGALEVIERAEDYKDGGMAVLSNVYFCFYDSLTRLAYWRDLERSGEIDKAERKALLSRVAENQKKLKKWAGFAPCNMRHLFQIVEAERYRFLQETQSAVDCYDLAIAVAKQNNYVQEEALANELIAQFYLECEKTTIAAAYMQEAYGCYLRWGAKAKLTALEQQYPRLLKPILQQQAAPTFGILETISSLDLPLPSLAQPKQSVSKQSVSMQTLSCHQSSTAGGINVSLDFAAILEASQKLSSTIHLDDLLQELTQSILQNAGGDRCTLLLPNERDIWQVEAIATPGSTTLVSEALEGYPNLPTKLIHYVKNTKTLVSIDDLETDLPVIDDYLTTERPKSLLVLPLLNQGQLIGVLHLENHLASGAFTQDRVRVLNLLCTQAAISLNNARLYKQAQAYSQQLESSQLQLVQSEKMSALGNLVAGVAHEINNPVGFLKGNINPAKNYVQDLFYLIDLLLEKLPEVDEEVEEELEDMNLDFIRQDLPELLGSMTIGVERIKDISTSLRTFSRADKEHKTLFNLQDGLDSTLLILKHRLKGNDHRPDIEIVKNYSDLMSIHCFPGQLNQVFMNILANAIDALEEASEGRPCAEIQASPNRIAIATQLSEDSRQVIIKIRDNGTGMPEDIRQRIFDHLYTTKRVGKGTGLGLAIAKQIIEEKHGGKITVSSAPGEGTEFAIALPRNL